MTQVTRPDGYAVTFTYDALGRRLSKRFRGKVTRWVWNGNKPLHEWQELEVGSGAGSVQDLTTWLFEEESFAPMAKLTAQGSYSILTDHLGTPLELYNEQGTKTWQAQLDSYGAVRQGQGKPQDCPFRYQGQYEDTETGLYYNRFRYFDPEVGLYISQAPIGLADVEALHSYVADPLTQLDVLGLSEGSSTLGNRMIKAGRTHGIIARDAQGNPLLNAKGNTSFSQSDFRAHHVIPH
ncbi:RHS repeat domain-containing protein [Hymenobacter cellulosivorans]|uniref:RHS domain-containing protein n=1 Tax=Hymenobacter cellulosivorans TaxID=2932249 RepID=A0ABY4FFU5_9BACT|nr:RHS domain-containing protein [Hymenobacter cellulosivorans]